MGFRTSIGKVNIILSAGIFHLKCEDIDSFFEGTYIRRNLKSYLIVATDKAVVNVGFQTFGLPVS